VNDKTLSERPTRAEFDHYGPHMGEQAPEVLAEMRAECPVAWSEQHGGFWVVTRYDDCHELSRDPQRYGNSTGTIPDLFGGLKLPPISFDPPEHGVYRDLLQSWFTLKRVQGFEEFVRRCAQARIDALGSPAELVAGFTRPFPRDVILGVIGVPDADVDLIGRMITDRMENATADQAEVRASTESLRQYMADTLIASRRRKPSDDLVSHLVASEIDGEPLGDELIAGLLHQVIGAGIDTTNKVLATALGNLAQDPAAQAGLREADLSVAVEEMLRLHAPVSVGRLCHAQSVVGGVPIEEGERLLLMFASANRDETQFPDPERIDWARSPNRHMAFGVGIHRCLGMHLARMELVIAFEELFAAFDQIELAPGGRVTFQPGQVWGASAVPAELRRR
jgi:cytochrome P450